MAQTCPIHIVREIERRWERRSLTLLSRAKLKTTSISATALPVCEGYAPIGFLQRRENEVMCGPAREHDRMSWFVPPIVLPALLLMLIIARVAYLGYG